MKIAIGCDEAGYALKEILKPFIVAQGHEVTDFGTFDGKPVLYPDIGHAVATAVAAGKHDSAVLKQLFDCTLVTKDNVGDFIAPFTLK